MHVALRYNYIGGRSANTAATANHAAATLWNAGTIPIWVTALLCTKTVATADNHALRRATARGTAGSTVTAGTPNEVRQQTASAVVLDLAAYSVQPTLATGELKRDNLPGTVGASFYWVFSEAIRVDPSAGLSLVTPVATILQASDISFEWYE